MISSKVLPIVLTLFCGFLGAVAQILFKAGSKDLSLSLSVFLNWRLMAGIFVYGVAMVIYLFALRNVDVMRLYPLIASSYIWAVILASVFLRERITPFTLTGVIIVTIGITVLSWQIYKQ